jgi:hypothetical protein
MSSLGSHCGLLVPGCDAAQALFSERDGIKEVIAYGQT